jgi:hypothetical protein
MVNKGAIDIITKQIKELESIRDQLLSNDPGGNLDSIFRSLDESYRKLLEELGYQAP